MMEIVNDGKQVLLDRTLAGLDESELRTLYDKVVERLKLIDKIKQLEAMSHFSVGDRVTFRHQDGNIVGKIIRLNRRTISIHTTDHHDWNVVPAVVSKIVEG